MCSVFRTTEFLDAYLSLFSSFKIYESLKTASKSFDRYSTIAK